MKKFRSQKIILEDKPPRKKFVKNAKMWCVTEFKDGKQLITWHDEEPELNSLSTNG